MLRTVVGATVASAGVVACAGAAAWFAAGAVGDDGTRFDVLGFAAMVAGMVGCGILATHKNSGAST